MNVDKSADTNHLPQQGSLPDAVTAEDYFHPRMGLRIVAAAVKLQDGRVICGVRHLDKLMRAVLPSSLEEAQACLAKREEGFVTNGYEFVDRNQAWRVAVMAGQIDFKVWSGIWGCLFSEDLW